jgi:hypothetical protein
MAVIKQSRKNAGTSKFNWNLSDQKAEAGTYPGIIVDILEVEDVERTYKDETRQVDVTRFLVAYTNDDDENVLAQTFEFNISANEKSNLMKFIANLRGKMPPFDGSYDTSEEMHKKCMVTIEERESKEGIRYGYVKSLAPISKKLAGACPDPDEIKIPGGKKFGASNEDDDELPPARSTKVNKSEDKDDSDPF